MSLNQIPISNGPFGSRYLIKVLNGTFKGYDDPNFHGTIIEPSSDFLFGHADGSGVTLYIDFVMKLHDGGVILGTCTGKGERDPANPAYARIHGGKTFEIGDDERYKWMNNEVFVGYGRKEGTKVEIDFYQVTD